MAGSALVDLVRANPTTTAPGTCSPPPGGRSCHEHRRGTGAHRSRAPVRIPHPRVPCWGLGMSERCPAMSRHQCRTRQSQILNVQDFALQRTSADTSAWTLASWPLLGPVVDMASMVRPVTEAQPAPPPGHSRVTHSRNRAVLAGHQRTRRPRHLCSAGPRRSRRDPRGTRRRHGSGP